MIVRRALLASVLLVSCSAPRVRAEAPRRSIDAAVERVAIDAGEEGAVGRRVPWSGCEARMPERVCLPAAIAQFGRAAPEAHFEERPPRAARLRAFEIDRDEATAADYRRCVTAGRCAPARCDDGGTVALEGAARCVSWADARDACTFLGGRLPSEAEWERAAAGALPGHRTHPWGDDAGAWVDARANGTIAIDDTTLEGVRALGGGVAEWVEDAGAFYVVPHHDAGADGDEAGPVNETAEREFADAGLELPGDSGWVLVDDPRGPRDGPWRVVRGGDDRVPIGAWTTSGRRFRQPGDRREWIGFRCAYDL